MPLKKVVSPDGKTFRWKCEYPDCVYQSEELRLSKETMRARPKECPKCGRK